MEEIYRPRETSNPEEEKNSLKPVIEAKEKELADLWRDIKMMPKEVIECQLRTIEAALSECDIGRLKGQDVEAREREVFEQAKSLTAQFIGSSSSQLRDASAEVQAGKDVRVNLRVIRSQIEFFDFHDFRRLLEIGRSQKNKIKKQGGLVLIGLSKSGKTTLSTAALGKKLKRTKILGMPTLQPIEKLEGEFARLVNSPELRSITRNPAFFEIQK